MTYLLGPEIDYYSKLELISVKQSRKNKIMKRTFSTKYNNQI